MLRVCVEAKIGHLQLHEAGVVSIAAGKARPAFEPQTMWITYIVRDTNGES
jgi:hypothetical protein